jgi:hypothetical protein
MHFSSVWLQCFTYLLPRWTHGAPFIRALNSCTHRRQSLLAGVVRKVLALPMSTHILSVSADADLLPLKTCYRYQTFRTAHNMATLPPTLAVNKLFDDQLKHVHAKRRCTQFGHHSITTASNYTTTLLIPRSPVRKRKKCQDRMGERTALRTCIQVCQDEMRALALFIPSEQSRCKNDCAFLSQPPWSRIKVSNEQWSHWHYTNTKLLHCPAYFRDRDKLSLFGRFIRLPVTLPILLAQERACTAVRSAETLLRTRIIIKHIATFFVRYALHDS